MKLQLNETVLESITIIPMEHAFKTLFSSPAFDVLECPCDSTQSGKLFLEKPEFHAINLITDGVFRFKQSTSDHFLTNQTILIDRPGDAYKIGLVQADRHRSLTIAFSPEILEEYYDGFFNQPVIHSSPTLDWIKFRFLRSLTMPSESLQVESAGYDLFNELMIGDYSSKYRAISIDSGLIGWHAASIEKAKDWMFGHFHEKITMRALAEQAGISEFHFSRLFKAYTSFSPYQYLINLRLAYSKKLLCDGSKSITQVAYESGFSSFSNFINTFRRHYGHSPSKLRKIAA
ncbi:AraC family transcriptional regulator [bacterium]|nr:AraC family transcriptional regulator [bacterium]